MLLANILPWATAFSFPYEIIPSFLLAADCGLMWLFSFFLFYTFLIFPQTGLAEPRGGPEEKFKQLLEPDERFKLGKFG